MMGLREKFDEANITADCRLTEEQARAAAMTQIVTNFAKIDKAGVGYVSFDQVKAFKGSKKASIASAKTKKASVAKVKETIERVAKRKASSMAGADVEVRFKRANTTGDGKLTRQQIGLAGNKPLGIHFDELDLEKKGYLTLEQVKAFSLKTASIETEVGTGKGIK